MITLFYQESQEAEFSMENEFAYLANCDDLPPNSKVFALLEFEHSAVIALNSKVLGSKLDTDIHTSSCRLAFEGQMLMPLTSEKYKQEDLPRLKVFKIKEKTGLVERANNEMELIGKNMFKKETNIHLFDNFKVKLDNGLIGKLDGPFGQSGKFKIRLDQPLNDELKALLLGKKKKTEDHASKTEVKLTFKKYIFNKKMAQN